MEPSAVKFQCQTFTVNPNEQINSVSSEVSLLELTLTSLICCISLCESLPLLLTGAFALSTEKTDGA